jgi:hypothetical protein
MQIVLYTSHYACVMIEKWSRHRPQNKAYIVILQMLIIVLPEYSELRGSEYLQATVIS